METIAPTPVSPEGRLESIDILRGVALFGVLVVNLIGEFRVSIFQQFLPTNGPTSMPDRMVEMFVSIVLEMKAFALFSILFGIGLAVQYERLSRRGQAYYWLSRRLLVLLAFGLLHLLFLWNGDILTEYAVAGMLVLPFLIAPTWAIAAGFACFLALYIVMPMMSLPIPPVILSLPDPPVIESLPEPPVMVSLPTPPVIENPSLMVVWVVNVMRMPELLEASIASMLTN